MATDKPTLAIIGGTGTLGSGLARRLAAAGYAIVLGSRSAEKAAEAARALSAPAGAEAPRGAGNAEMFVLHRVGNAGRHRRQRHAETDTGKRQRSHDGN